jgi:poly(3-hydroxybutyrate) depolymerase
LLDNRLEEKELTLTANPQDWSAQIKDFLRPVFNPFSVYVEEPPPPSRTFIEELEQKLRGARGLDANVALLNLAAVDPTNPLLASFSLEKADDLQRLNVGEFLTFAFRDWLVEKLPVDNPQRRWLQLMRIYSYLPHDPRGKIISGKQEDYLKLLLNFITVSGADLPGLLARYSLLYDTQGQMPLPELIATSGKLLADLRAADGGEFRELGRVADYTEAILRLARIASGETGIEFDMEPMNKDERRSNSLPCPRSIRLSWQRGKPTPTLEPYVPWRTNIVSFFKMTPVEKITAARSCLLIYGRGGFTEIARDEWLAQNPNSLTMTAFAVSSLDKICRDLGLPIQHRFDGKAELASYRRQIEYVANGVEYWLARTRHEDVLRYTDYVNRLLGVLNERPLLEIFTDEEYVTLRQKLTALTAQAFQRAGRDDPSKQPGRHLSWPELTREKVGGQTAHILYNFDEEPLNRDWFTNKLSDAAQAATADGDFKPAAWWNLLRTKKLDETFTYPELARFYLKLHTASFKLAGSGDLTGKELSRLFEQALTLLYGGERTAAVELLEKLQALPVTDLNRGYNNDLIRINTAYRLAQIYRADGRVPEAVQKLREGLQLADGGTFKGIIRRYEEKWENEVTERGISGDLSRKLAGVLSDMRFQPERAELPDRVGVVTVPTPNLDNPELRIFYRVPAATDGKSRRVLTLAVGSNAEVLSYLQPGGAWARFADAYNLVLVAPQFRAQTYHWNSSSVFCHYASAQVWSGAAFLAGLDKINERCPLQKDGLLFHGYAPGTGFVCRFARWRPDLVAAVALCRPSQGGLARFVEPGLQPLKSLSAVKIFIGAAEIDDDQCRDKTTVLYNRYETAVHFVTLLQAADVASEWKNYAGLQSPPVTELENDARTFLASQLTENNYGKK